jgi:hypothetical protein
VREAWQKRKHRKTNIKFDSFLVTSGMGEKFGRQE